MFLEIFESCLSIMEGGGEFRNYGHPAAEFGEDADPYMAAAGHFGNQSVDLVKHYATDLGFVYYSARNKKEFLNRLEAFLDISNMVPMVFEVFTKIDDESEAYKILRNLYQSKEDAFKQGVKGILGENGTKLLKKMIGRKEGV